MGFESHPKWLKMGVWRGALQGGNGGITDPMSGPHVSLKDPEDPGWPERDFLKIMPASSVRDLFRGGFYW